MLTFANTEIFHTDPTALQAWVKGWIDDCHAGRRIGIKMIQEAANKIHERQKLIEPLSPEKQRAFDVLNQAEKEAQLAYETAVQKKEGKRA